MNRRIALVTGGSRGLGRSTVVHLARRGVDSILTWVDRADAAAEVVAEVEGAGAHAVPLPLDVADAASFPAFAQRVRETLRATWGREQLDILVNNAGVGIHASYASTTEAQFDRLMAIHLKAPFFLTQTLLPLIADGGRIVNLSSGLARFALPGYAAYGTMKAGVEGLTRYQAKELGARRIAVNAFAPGAIETDFGGGAVRDNPQVNAFVAAQTAMGRAGRPDDIGGAIAALVEPENGWITGQRIEASGGMFL